MKMDFSEAG